MEIIQPSFRLDSPYSYDEGVRLLRTIEHCARVSHAAEERQTEDSWQRFLTAVVMQKGDWSVTEHASARVTLRVDRGCTHEIVRHRLFSYTQESTRFVNYGKKTLEFVEPSWVADCPTSIPAYAWQQSMRDAELTYLEMLKDGRTPQEARSVLPNSTAATLVMTGNLRNWRHFFLMRTTKETHPDLKRVTIPMLAAFQERIPILYDDIVPNEKQSVSLSKPK